MIIDPLIRCLGNVSENHAGSMNTILSALRKLQLETQCSILLSHHNKKGSKSGGESLRGSSNLFSWIDFGFYCSKPAEQTTLVEMQYKGFPESCPLFFEIKEVNNGIVPMCLGFQKK